MRAGSTSATFRRYGPSLLALAATPALATAQGPGIAVTDGPAPYPVAESFEGCPEGEVAGILVGNGAACAEDAVGQTTVKLASGFEETSGAPSTPLSLATPPAADGVYCFQSDTLFGLAEGTGFDEIAEGAIAILYNGAHPEVGVRIDGGQPGGTVTFRCFDAAGQLLGAQTVPSLPEREVTITSLGAPLRLVNVTNDDPGGIGLQALRHPVVNGVPYCFGDGGGGTCPCGNWGGAGRGCASGAFAEGARLTALSTDSLEATQVTPGQPVLFFQGDNATAGGDGIPFGDGLRCVGGGVLRLLVATADAGGVAGLPSIAAEGGGGAGKRYQAWYRDPQLSPCGTGFNFSNGVELP